jgi:nicotinamidase/pyrazinamidase
MRGLLIVDIQQDFCEGGALAVAGGNAVAEGVAELLERSTGTYPVAFASRDFHEPMPNLNGGHFAAPGFDPDYVNTWPVHCVRGTEGAAFHPAIVPALSARLGRWAEIVKGQGQPDYSAFQGREWLSGNPLSAELARRNVTELDIVGLATDYCVYQSAISALMLDQLREVRVLTDLCAGVSEQTTAVALDDLQKCGAKLVSTSRV